MKRLIVALLLLLAAGPAFAAQTGTVTGTFTGTITLDGVCAPPPVVPPPVVPPPVVPPPLEDTSPFAFPAQPSFNEPPPDARYTYVTGSGSNDMTREGGFYTGLSRFPNPLGAAYLYAGNVPNGERLWTPRSANPAHIRRVLATGRM